MLPYSPTVSTYSDSIQVYETTDPADADLLNNPLKQLLQNDIKVKEIADAAKEEADNAKVFEDDTTSDLFRMGVDNGLLYIEEVEQPEPEPEP